MSLNELVSKYIASTDHVFRELKITETSVNFDVDTIKEIVATAKAYLADAKYYKDTKNFAVSLTSVAYSEGVLDALKMLGAVKFEWPTKKKGKSET